MFLGQVGSGKTYLSIAILNVLMDNEYYTKKIPRFKNAKVLFVYDLFKGSFSGSDVNIMFEIINHRYFNGMPVIVSCEKSVEELLKIDEAIGSRLVEMCKVSIVEIRDKRLNYRMCGCQMIILNISLN